MYIVWKTACSTTEGSGACSINYTKKKNTNTHTQKKVFQVVVLAAIFDK